MYLPKRGWIFPQDAELPDIHIFVSKEIAKKYILMVG